MSLSLCHLLVRVYFIPFYFILFYFSKHYSLADTHNDIHDNIDIDMSNHIIVVNINMNMNEQELYRRNGRCESVRYEGGRIIIDNGEPVAAGG